MTAPIPNTANGSPARHAAMHPVTDFRRCFTCGHIAKYTEHTLPSCQCRRCGSADTWKMRSEPPLWIGTLGEQRGVYVPDFVGKCPECGEGLIATCYEWDAETGRPVATGIELTCLVFLREDTEDKRGDHAYTQDKWQPIRDAVVKWCDARVDYGR